MIDTVRDRVIQIFISGRTNVVRGKVMEMKKTTLLYVGCCHTDLAIKCK